MNPPPAGWDTERLRQYTFSGGWFSANLQTFYAKILNSHSYHYSESSLWGIQIQTGGWCSAYKSRLSLLASARAIVMCLNNPESAVYLNCRTLTTPPMWSKHNNPMKISNGTNDGMSICICMPRSLKETTNARYQCLRGLGRAHYAELTQCHDLDTGGGVCLAHLASDTLTLAYLPLHFIDPATWARHPPLLWLGVNCRSNDSFAAQ